jgi:hypothetical protein
MDIADWNFVPFVRRLLMAACRSPSAICRGERVKSPSGMSMALEVSCTCRTQPWNAFLFIRCIDADGRGFVISPGISK